MNAFELISYPFDMLSQYIWSFATWCIAVFLLLAIVRIWFWFVFKIFRLQDNYEVRKTNWARWQEQAWEKHVSESIDEFENWRRIFH